MLREDASEHVAGWAVLHSQPALLNLVRDVKELNVQVAGALRQQALAVHFQLHGAHAVLMQRRCCGVSLRLQEVHCPFHLAYAFVNAGNLCLG